MSIETRQAAGASFLTTPVTSADFLTPEKLSDELRQIQESAATFMQRDVVPHTDSIEHQEAGLMPSLLKQAGEQGLLMIDVPEEYGGMELGLVASALVAHEL